MANTQRSVLLSTKIRKAPIPLVSHNNVPIRPVTNPTDPNFLLRYASVSRTNPKPNIITNTPLKKFKLTATVSGAIQKNDFIGSISANQKAI